MKPIISNKNLLKCLFVFLISLSACKETISYLPSPSISIKSVKQVSLSSFEIEIMFDQGEGQLIRNIELEFEDLTISTGQKIKEEIKIDNTSTTLKYIFNSGKINHDYLVSASLNTDKYQYQTEKVIYRSPKNNFYFRVQEDDTYGGLDPTVAIQLNKGAQFTIVVNYLNLFEGKPKVKLDNIIECKNSIDFNYAMYLTNGLETAGLVTIPLETPPGDYSIFIEVEGVSFKLDEKIRVLNGEWTIFNENYSGRKMGDYAWFVIDNLLYIVGGSSYSSSIIDSPVWSLNLDTGEWQKKNNFEWPPEQSPYAKKIFPIQLSYKNQGYILTQTDDLKIQIWGYNNLNDSWTKIADYPGTGIYSLLCFNVGNEIFVGGGVKLESNWEVPLDDFWSYNIDTDSWKQLKNYPVKQIGFDGFLANTSCTLNDKEYVFQMPDKLWEYSPDNDSWNLKTIFPGPRRQDTRLVPYGNNIFVIGGSNPYQVETYKDCWKYSIADDVWNMKSFMPNYTNYGIAIPYNNSIIYGMGYAQNAYSFYDDQKIYRFNY